MFSANKGRKAEEEKKIRQVDPPSREREKSDRDGRGIRASQNERANRGDEKGRRDYGREFVEERWPGTKRGNSRRV